MEACIENYSKGPMVLEYVRFDAVPPLHAVSIDIRDVLMADFISDNPLGSYIDQLQVPYRIVSWAYLPFTTSDIHALSQCLSLKRCCNKILQHMKSHGFALK